MKKAYLKHITALLLFGLNGIVASNIALSSYEIVLLRTLLGTLFLGFLFFITKGKFTFLRHKKDLLYLAVSGAAMGASWMFLYEGYAQIGVSLSSLLYYSGPIFVMVLSPFIFGEKLTLTKTAGFSAVICGILLINGISGADRNFWGFFCGIMSAVTYAFMVIANKKSKKIEGMENSLLQLLFSFLTVTTFVALKSGLSLQIEKNSIIWILILCLINTGGGCYLYFSSMGRLPAQTVAVCGYLEALSAVIFSAIFLEEKMTPLQILGGALIIGGAVLGECMGFKKQKEA